MYILMTLTQLHMMGTLDHVYFLFFLKTVLKEKVIYVTGLVKLKFKRLLDVLLTRMQVNQGKDLLDGTAENVVRKTAWKWMALCQIVLSE